MPSALRPLPSASGPVLTERLTYRVDHLQVRALICRPDLRPGRPLLNLVHGGLDSPVDEAACRRFARLGYVVAASALRGQGGSQGRPEICGGEVDDVRALSSLVRQRSKTDPRRIGYLGVSLGGCVAIKAAALGSGVRAVVTLLSPTDFAEQLDLLRPVRPDAVARWEALLGGPASARPAAYEARRPLKALARLRAPLLTVAAGRDQLIPLKQSCAVRDVRRLSGHHVTEVRQNQAGRPAPRDSRRRLQRCRDEAPLGRLPALQRQDVLLIYEDLGHTSTPLMWRTAEAFLKANL
ncbi:alpha/beta hydrolase family protein [Deinococcus irradiatisoli]|uniref:alpha/beta hydrolase family protein n=1 Tax=Deinococcus irradiatisoli TaxID=2202254 RepID=UPI0015E842EF|nr:alpha/beta fold hydrolase [Deinococcus irradiatisoli]